MNVLGISAFYHDSAAALVRGGEIVAAAQEERFTRVKHDHRFPSNAIRYCLAEGDVGRDGIDAVAFYDKPLLKFSRILQTYFAVAPRGLRSFFRAIPLWGKQKLWISMAIEKEIERAGHRMPERLVFTEHHESHAASAFYPSPFDSAAILTIDGVGEWATSSIGRGDGARIDLLEELRFPHSVGLLYSAFTYHTGFRVNSGEYKLMGLAPYGRPRFVDVILDELIDLRDDGSLRLDLSYFAYLDGLTMTNGRFDELFGGPPRRPEAPITQREMDMARSIQVVTEEIVLRMARHAHELTGEENLCLAGGVALNCVANGRVLREGPFRDIWIQPAAGDAGGALGAALAVVHQVDGLDRPRTSNTLPNDRMRGAYLGPAFDDDEIGEFLRVRGYPATRLADDERASRLADLLADEKVVGVLDGRMEFGPRALGARSILGDARSPKMQSVMNLKIKFRESFRPFAPICLSERADEYFEIDRPSPYMLLVADVASSKLLQTEPLDAEDVVGRVNQVRSEIPAVTHLDNSARLQTVHRETNPRLHAILEAFAEQTGCPVLINTSFNVRGEPIVCTPEDAYRCFMRTDMDALVLGSWLLLKPEQPPWDGPVGLTADDALD